MLRSEVVLADKAYGSQGPRFQVGYSTPSCGTRFPSPLTQMPTPRHEQSDSIQPRRLVRPWAIGHPIPKVGSRDE